MAATGETRTMGLDDVRAALRARARGGYFQRLHAQLNEHGVGVALGAIDQFSTGTALLPQATVKAIVEDIWQSKTWDGTNVVDIPRAPAITLGRPPGRFEPQRVPTNETGKIWPGLREQLEEQKRIQWENARAIARGERR